MRYVRYKKVLTKLHDEIVEDADESIGILQVLKEKEITCKIRLSSGPRYNMVRILTVSEEKKNCLICIITEHASLRKTVPISEIDFLEVETDIELFVSSKADKMSRFFMLEPTDID